MRRIYFIALSAIMLIVSANASAQPRPSHRPVTSKAARGFGIDFGYVHSSYRTTDWATDEVETSAGLDGFVAGLTKDFRLIPGALYFQTGLKYIYQNDERNENVSVAGFDTGIKVVGDRTEHYLALPVRLKYTLPVTDRIGLGIDFGPTLLCGLSSNLKYRTRFADGETSAVTYNIYKGEMGVNGVLDGQWNLKEWVEQTGMLPDGSLNRFDVMLGAAIGADFFNVLEVRIGYDWGLINRYKKEIAEDLIMRRGQFNLSVAVRF
jgi:opacity protein-like surface antigen